MPLQNCVDRVLEAIFAADSNPFVITLKPIEDKNDIPTHIIKIPADIRRILRRPDLFPAASVTVQYNLDKEVGFPPELNGIVCDYLGLPSEVHRCPKDLDGNPCFGKIYKGKKMCYKHYCLGKKEQRLRAKMERAKRKLEHLESRMANCSHMKRKKTKID